MGVLDDAIREHLELKRKHGASEGEIVEQEQEALGAPRRQAAEQPAAEPEEVAAVPKAEPPAPAPEAPEAEADVADPAPDAVEAPPEPEPEPEPGAGGDTPPRGFEAVEETSPAEGDEEDVLEETPDFLQETPEHDRLWFEQKPPRDFDFDE